MTITTALSTGFHMHSALFEMFFVLSLLMSSKNTSLSPLYKSFLLSVRLFVYGVIKMFAALIANCCTFAGSVLILIPAIYHNLVLNNVNFYTLPGGWSGLYSTFFFFSSSEYNANANKLFLHLYSVFEAVI